MSAIYTVTLHDKDQNLTQQLCLYDDISPDDIRSIISASFNSGKNLIGVFDNDTNVYFPISMIAANISIFRSGVFTLVYSSHNTCNDDSSNDVVRKRTAKAYDFISATMKIPLELIDAFIDIIVAEVRSRTSIQSVKIGMILQAVSHFADPSNEIGKSKFIASMNYLTQSSDRKSDMATDQTTYERIFDCLAKGDSRVNVFRLCRFLALFCGGIPNENVKMLFFLFDFDRDGIVTAGDVYHCFRDCLGGFSALYDDVFAVASACRLDDVAKLLTISVFRSSDAPTSALTLESFYTWYSSRFSEDGDDHMLYSAHLMTELGISESVGSRESEISVSSIAEARTILSLLDIAPSTLKECIVNYADATNPQFISRRGLFCAVILASRVHSVDVFSRGSGQQQAHILSSDADVAERMQDLLLAELLLLQLFAMFDPLRSGFVNRDDIFCGLSPFCGGSWVDRVTAMFTSSAIKQRAVLDSLDTHLQLLVSRSDMMDYLVSVLKSVLLFSDYDLDEPSVQRLAGRMLDDAVAAGNIPVQGAGGNASAINFANWIESAVDTDSGNRRSKIPGEVLAASDRLADKTARTPRTTAIDGEVPFDSVIPETPPLVSQELLHMKSSLGFVGFSAEDVMDHLGECSQAGMITLSNWLQVVRHMRLLDTDPNSSEQSEYAMEVAQQIFMKVAELHSPVYSPDMELSVSYSHLLAAVSVLCDSPEEDKIAVAFMVLATSEDVDDVGSPKGLRLVSYTNLVNYFRGVLTVTCTCSPLAREQVLKANVSIDDLAVAGVNRAVRAAGLSRGIDNFDLEEFGAVAWSCVQA